MEDKKSLLISKSKVMSGAVFFGYALWLLHTRDSEKGSRKM